MNEYLMLIFVYFLSSGDFFFAVIPPEFYRSKGNWRERGEGEGGGGVPFGELLLLETKQSTFQTLISRQSALIINIRA